MTACRPRKNGGEAPVLAIHDPRTDVDATGVTGLVSLHRHRLEDRLEVAGRHPQFGERLRAALALSYRAGAGGRAAGAAPLRALAGLVRYLRQHVLAEPIHVEHPHFRRPSGPGPGDDAVAAGSLDDRRSQGHAARETSLVGHEATKQRAVFPAEDPHLRRTSPGRRDDDVVVAVGVDVSRGDVQAAGEILVKGAKVKELAGKAALPAP